MLENLSLSHAGRRHVCNFAAAMHVCHGVPCLMSAHAFFYAGNITPVSCKGKHVVHNTQMSFKSGMNHKRERGEREREKAFGAMLVER